MRELPSNIYRADAVRALDRMAIEEQQIPGYTLMVRAGQALLEALNKRFPEARRLVVLCGGGNNGGDGYVLARMARAKGLQVELVALTDPARLKGDAALACATFREGGGVTTEWTPRCVDRADVIVDAILGTGLTRPLAGAAAEVVGAVAASGVPVLAVDMPTGLHSDTGQVLGDAIAADVTVTFVGLKLGAFVGAGPSYCGELVFDGLGIPPELYERVRPAARRIGRGLRRDTLPPRARDAHKGEFGHVLVVGGGRGMPGAARLAAEGALRSGAGRVTVATRPDNVTAVVAARPEVMCAGIDEPDGIAPLLGRADVVALGPGLGTDGWAQGLLRTVEASGLPVVADADALNLLALNPQRHGNWVLTPHPGEAGRLLAADAAAVQRDREGALGQLCVRYGGIVVLKGAGTLVGREGEVPWICDRGNPGMAAPGMGDVLTGVIAGIAAQCGDLFAAARVGVYAHAQAGDRAAAKGQRGMTALDVCAQLPHVLN